MTIQQILNAVQEKHSTIRSSFKWTYRTYFEQLRTKHLKGEYISEADIKFLEHILYTDYNQLRDKAYINGVWYDYKPKHIKLYNLVHKKPVKFAQLGKYR